MRPVASWKARPKVVVLGPLPRSCAIIHAITVGEVGFVPEKEGGVGVDQKEGASVDGVGRGDGDAVGAGGFVGFPCCIGQGRQASRS